MKNISNRKFYLYRLTLIASALFASRSNVLKLSRPRVDQTILSWFEEKKKIDDEMIGTIAHYHPSISSTAIAISLEQMRKGMEILTAV